MHRLQDQKLRPGIISGETSVSRMFLLTSSLEAVEGSFPKARIWSAVMA
jgi:hypothetical protein